MPSQVYLETLLAKLKEVLDPETFAKIHALALPSAGGRAAAAARRAAAQAEPALVTKAAEDAVIAANRRTPAAQVPHDFRAASWAGIGGRPRCLVCGGDEPAGGRCAGRVTKSAHFESEVTWLEKADVEGVVYGIVLAPDQRDSQGDRVSADEIRKAAWRWMEHSRQHTDQHGPRADAVPVESFIAPTDFVVTGLDGSPVHITNGSWVMASKVNDRGLLEQILTHKKTGFSIGGTGIRVQEDRHA